MNSKSIPLSSPEDSAREIVFFVFFFRNHNATPVNESNELKVVTDHHRPRPQTSRVGAVNSPLRARTQITRTTLSVLLLLLVDF